MDDRGSGLFVSAYEANYPDVLRYVQRRTRADLVEEIVAETFLIAWRRRDVLPVVPRPWLFRTAANVLKSTMRREGRQVALAVRLYQPESEFFAADASEELVLAWRQLSLRDREVIALRAWEELSDTEAAQVLGCTRAAYAMRLTRARRRLAAKLGRSDPAEGSGVVIFPRTAEEQT